MKIDLTTQVQNILPIANGGTGNASGAMLPNFADNETPAGTVNGSNNVFVLAHVPNPQASLQQFKNSSLMLQGVDYSLSQSTVTFTVPPASGSNLRAWYRWNVNVLMAVIRGEQIFWSDVCVFNALSFLVVSDSAASTHADAFSWAYQLSSVIAETMAMSTALVVGYGLLFAEAMVQHDSVSVGQYFADTLTLSDSFNFVLAGGASQALLVDTMTMTDGLTGFQIGLVITDGKLMFDFFEVNVIHVVLTDSNTMTDHLSKQLHIV